MKKKRKDKQRSTKHTHNTKDWVTRTPLKTGVNSGVLPINVGNLFLKQVIVGILQLFWF
jgi:hypothetical protein